MSTPGMKGGSEEGRFAACGFAAPCEAASGTENRRYQQASTSWVLLKEPRSAMKNGPRKNIVIRINTM